MELYKKINLIFITIFVIGFVLIFSFIKTPVKSQNLYAQTLTSNDDTSLISNSLAGEFDISLISRNGNNIILSNPVTYYDGQAYRSYWSNTKSFSISYIVDENNLPPSNSTDPDEPSTYDFSLTVRYLKGYLSANNFDTLETQRFENIYKINEDDYTAFANLDFVLNIDEGLGNDVNWGIYQFIVDINGAEATSLYYAIEPTTVIADQPIIDYSIPSSASGSLNDLFSFYIVNEETFKYVDTRNLTWYVWGQSNEGIKYALTSEDLEDETFVSLACTQALYTSYPRNGATFELEINELYGDWHVWCVYNYDNSPAPLLSETVTVSTTAPFDYFNVVYIIVGIAGFALIVTIVVAIIRNKKEKVW